MHGSSFNNVTNHRTSSGTDISVETYNDSSSDSVETNFTIKKATVARFCTASARHIHLSTVVKSAPAKKALEKVPILSSPHQMAFSGLWHIKPNQPLVEPSNPIPIYQCQETCVKRAAPPKKMKHNLADDDEGFQNSSLDDEILRPKIAHSETTFINSRVPLISLEEAQERERLRRNRSMGSIKSMSPRNSEPGSESAKSEMTPLRSLARRLSVFSHTRPKINWTSNHPQLPNRPESGKKRVSKGKKLNGKPTSVKGKKIQVIHSAQSCCSQRSDLISLADAQRQAREYRHC
ncbi:hypothetical protein DFH28DRAFT_929743 [Melampsora americana]|nr:hypothetical protein DFH28DRAFT_1135090 [Melampsora americana]KAH9813732.1 hypothetical protein DFH28DRAFT_929743 [Melampsora americana]